mmetsp:Transcript_23790/g.45354  ORF Transcript_23790/g.45354 Transcript_23790/m.45354 type:complete len:102 (-) Transcript_23790:358-663(-)
MHATGCREASSNRVTWQTARIWPQGETRSSWAASGEVSHADTCLVVGESDFSHEFTHMFQGTRDVSQSVHDEPKPIPKKCLKRTFQHGRPPCIYRAYRYES